MFVSQLVAQQLAVYFLAREEFIAVVMLLALFALIGIIIFGIVYFVSGKIRSLDIAGAAMAGSILLPTIAIILFGMATSGWKLPSAVDWQIAVEILLPSLVLVLVQWWMVRRRRIKMAAA